jgi:hypothetical protein
MDTQISFLSQGGSGLPVPDLSIEVDDLDDVLTRKKKKGFQLSMDQLRSHGEFGDFM